MTSHGLQHVCSVCGIPAASTPAQALYLPAGSDVRYCQWCHPTRQPRPLSAAAIDAQYESCADLVAA